MKCCTKEKSVNFPRLQTYRTGCRIYYSRPRRKKDIFCPLSRIKTEVKLVDDVDVEKRPLWKGVCRSHFIRGGT